MHSRSREGYTFSKSLREERTHGCEGQCEYPGCNYHGKLEAHHLLACFLASHNPVLTPQIIRQIESVQMLCPKHHKLSDEDQKTWTPYDIAWQAFALYDLDLKEVEMAQHGTYLDKTWNNPPYKSKKKRYGKKRSNRTHHI